MIHSINNYEFGFKLQAIVLRYFCPGIIFVVELFENLKKLIILVLIKPLEN